MRKLSFRDNALRLREEAFSLLEVLVAITLFSIVSMGLARGFIMQMRSNTDSEIRAQALSAAQFVLDRLRTVDLASLPSSGSATPEIIAISGRNYSVIISYCSLSSYCIAATTRHLRASVSYQNEKRYEVDTVFTQLR
jgi:prepilin-type N-terminal cleavage/methylation domain-containing protein